ncbi:MAG TPA: Gfo/Idh/MocA family oxidoreductase [Gemmatimonadales bacterium]|jgi:predicted dehydrogenase
MGDGIRVGVIGAGAITQVAHLPVLASLKGVEVVGLCDNDTAKAGALAGRFGIRDVFDDIEDLLQYSRPQAIAVCTPNHLHEIHVLTALSRGVHVLCERPLALTVQGVEKIRAMQQKSGAALLVGMNHRFRSDVQAVRAFVNAGELGTLRDVRAGWYMFRPQRTPMIGWRERRVESGGGAMLDIGLPLIDLGLWLAGYPVPRTVTASLGRDTPGAGVEDAGVALLSCDGGVTILVDVSWHFIGDAERFWLDLIGSKGSASAAPLQVFKELHGTPMNVTPTGATGRENAFTASYRAEWAHFLAIVGGTVEKPALQDQLTLHRVVDAVYRSAAEGRSVSL